MSLRLAVFASGSGSNLQALLDRFHQKRSEAARIVLVVSDRESAGALDRARKANLETVVIPVIGRPIDYVARETLASLDGADVDLIALAGYLRLVPPVVVRHYRNRIINIHPALLPAFGGKGMFGMRVHRAVIESGATVTGVTIHLVDEKYDEGQIVAQWPVPVLPDDSAERLAARVLQVEHLLYPAAIEALARSRVAGDPPRRFGAGAFGSFQYSTDASPTEADVRTALGVP